MITNHKLLFQLVKFKVPNLQTTMNKQTTKIVYQLRKKLFQFNHRLKLKKSKHHNHKHQKKLSLKLINKNKRKNKFNKMTRWLLLIKNQFNKSKQSKNYDCLEYNLYYIIYFILLRYFLLKINIFSIILNVFFKIFLSFKK